MQVVEIEDGLAVKISELAKSENKSLTEFVNFSLHEILKQIEHNRNIAEKEVEKIVEKEKRHVDGYKRFPARPDEFEIEDEQMEKFWDKL